MATPAHYGIGESCGALVNVAIFGKLFGGSAFELIHEGDNTTEGPMFLGRAASPDQIVSISDALRR